MGHEFDGIKDLYDKNVDLYGTDSRSVGWKSYESQQLRFDVLNRLFENQENEFSFNDLGSGYGAHLVNLVENGFKLSSYNAYDLSNKMLDKLVFHLKHVQVKISTHNSSEIKTLCDYSVACGTFNVKGVSSESEWEKIIKASLSNMNQHSLKGFGFNLLTSEVDWRDDNLYYGNPVEWKSYCEDTFRRPFELITNYGLYEWTLISKPILKEFYT